ncbi:MAG: hypothetical protein ACR2NY_03750 [Alphaproteobacteria bacterium]
MIKNFLHKTSANDIWVILGGGLALLIICLLVAFIIVVVKFFINLVIFIITYLGIPIAIIAAIMWLMKKNQSS